MAIYDGLLYEVPDIDTVWKDKQAYPYAAIVGGWGSQYYFLYLSTVPFTASTHDYNDFIVSESKVAFRCKLHDSFWETYTSEGDEMVVWNKEYNLWTSHDIFYADGTLFKAASVLTLTARDLYRKINGKPTKLTLYKKLGGKLVPLDEHTKEVKT